MVHPVLGAGHGGVGVKGSQLRQRDDRLRVAAGQVQVEDAVILRRQIARFLLATPL